VKELGEIDMVPMALAAAIDTERQAGALRGLLG
jgi:hypothetical protein